jgi:hypothetical protein
MKVAAYFDSVDSGGTRNLLTGSSRRVAIQIQRALEACCSDLGSGVARDQFIDRTRRKDKKLLTLLKVVPGFVMPDLEQSLVSLNAASPVGALPSSVPASAESELSSAPFPMAGLSSGSVRVFVPSRRPEIESANGTICWHSRLALVSQAQRELHLPRAPK